MSDKPKAKFQELAHQALDNYHQALQTSLKLQEESARSWADFLRATTATPATWLEQPKQALGRAVLAAQQRLQECHRLFEENSRAGLDLLNQAIQTTNPECSKKATEELERVLERALANFRNGVDAITEFNGKALECWSQVFEVEGQPNCGGQKAKK